ncbi:hypothetical protein ACQRD4_00930 [Streptococcus hyointestinalis]|uniref:hypothetical protein n=1 Tax=Streptococcus hyointestinalis TaxID=1337 RepID=UPI003D0290F5
MSNSDSTLLNLLENNCILYLKNGRIEHVQAPEYGRVTLAYHDGKFSHYERAETKK